MSGPSEDRNDEIRQAVRRYATEQLAPHGARWDRNKEFPREALKGLAAMGLYGVAIAEEWGGAGMNYTALAVACEEISAGDCSTATIVSVNNLVAGILAGYGNAQQKEKFLRNLCSGENPRGLRPDRAPGRLRRIGHHHARRAARRALCAERGKAVHHLGQERRLRGCFRRYTEICRKTRY